MLHITPEAGLTINRLADDEGVAGVRIAAQPGQSVLSISTATSQEETDLVVTEETTGARVLFDSPTADYLADMTLDVDDTVEGVARFRLASRGMPA